MVTLEKTYSNAESTVRKGENLKKMFAKEDSSTRKSASDKRRLSFEQKLQNKMKDSQNNRLNDENSKVNDEKDNIKGVGKESNKLESMKEKTESKGKENDLTLEKSEDKFLTEKAKDLEKSKELLDIVNAIYQFLNPTIKLDDNGNDDLQKLNTLLQDANLNLKSVDGKESLLQKILGENKLNLAELNKVIENQKNEKMALDKLEAEDLIKLLIRKLQEGTEKDDKLKKKPSDEIVNYKPLNISTKSKNVDVDLIKEKSSFKEDNFLRSLIGESEEEKGINKPDGKVSKISRMDILNNHFKVDKSTPVEVKENLTVNKATILDDVVKNVKYMELNNLKNLTVKVNPKELGEIVIKLTMEAGKFKLALNASSKDTYYLLNSNIGEISEKLNEGNIKIQPAEINIYNQDTTFFSNEFSGSRNDSRENGNSYRKEFLVQDKSISDDEEMINNYEFYKGNLNAKV